MPDLTNSQKVFCQEYIYDWNATRAYKVAYPSIKSDNSACVLANRLLRKVNIATYIKEIQKDLEKLAGISRLKIANEFIKLGFSNASNLRNTWMELKDFEELTEDQKACIAETETKIVKQKNYLASTPDCPVYDDVEYVKIKLHDKQRALENLNKMLGYNEPEKIQISDLTNKIQTVYDEIQSESDIPGEAKE